MIYFLTASQDATIYSGKPIKNSGLDQILEILNLTGSYSSRTLIKFDINSIKNDILTNNITISDAVLSLRETETTNVPINYEILINPISGSWEMGDGYIYDTLNGTGVTWKNRNNVNGEKWNTGSFGINSTGSNLDGYGGVWWTNYSASNNYSYKTSDLNVSIKSIFNAWINNTIPNDGLILRLNPSYESIATNLRINFFSKESNTIYKPKIYVGWNDSTFNTGSLLPITDDNIKIKITNLKESYRPDDTYRFNVIGTELYPIKTFANAFIKQIKYLPSSSYYQIKDLLSGDIIVPFSDFTKLSCDQNGNYFKLNLSNFELRKYQIEFKTYYNGYNHYYSDGNTFYINE